MADERPKPEEIIKKLRQVEVLTSQGMPRLDAIRQIGVTEQTRHCGKKKYGGMGTDQSKELKLSHIALLWALLWALLLWASPT